MRGHMKHLLMTVGCIAMLSACDGGSGSLSGNSSAGGSSGGQSAQSSGSNNSSSFGSKRTENTEFETVKVVDSRAYVSTLTSARMETSKGGKMA